jgi:flavin-binding protein dodecin
MSVAKVIEISAGSPESFEDAVRKRIERTTETLEDVRGAWIKEQQVRLENGKIVEFRVDMKVTFVLHESEEYACGFDGSRGNPWFAGWPARTG